VDGLAVAEAGVVRLGDGAPAAAAAEDGEDVVVVADGLEVEEEGRVAELAEGGGGEVGGAVSQDEAGGPAGGAAGLLVVGDVGVEEALDFGGGGEAGEDGALFAGELVGRHPAQVNAPVRRRPRRGSGPWRRGSCA